jgi:sodium/potassium-transporting ATPase subunit alpha
MSLVVAFIPEGMPIAVALTLSLVARRMRDARILPKSLSVVETLGCVNVVCSDKTGTLTENRMSIVSLGFVDRVFTPKDAPVDSIAFRELRKGMTLCNDSKFDDNDVSAPVETRKVIGNATDGALLRYQAALPSSDISSAYSRLYDLPFNSKNKFAVTVIGNKDVSTCVAK